jgi:CubicO group peptidase (beta-lactamase class C family)
MADLLQEKVFTPLKMDHTSAYVSKALSSRQWILARPYIYTPAGSTRSWLEKTDNNMQSAGGIFASIKDIGTWLTVNMNEGKLKGRQVIPADIILQCQTGYTKTKRDGAPFPGDGEYGLGWQIGNYKNEKVIYHHGSFPGYRSHISFLPGKKLAVAVLINDGSVGGRTGHMIATYVYDSWMQVEKTQEDHVKQLNDLVASFEKNQAIRPGRCRRTGKANPAIISPAGKLYRQLYSSFSSVLLK